MSRKSTRSTKQSEAASPSPATPPAPAQRVTLSRRFSEAAAPPDYAYVKKDLKRVGILAGSMFAGMVLLYFILPYILPLYAR
jgi:hypothetical protein